MSVTDHLQEMADIAQDQGMHPDNINAVCDCFSELLAALKYAVQFSNADINPIIRKRLAAAIANAEGRAS